MKILKFFNLINQHMPDGQDAEIDCLWCGGHTLSISAEPNHQFQCWKCKTVGNIYTIVRKLYEDMPALTMQQAMKLAKLKKGIHPSAFRKAGVKAIGNDYFIPAFNHEKQVLSLHKYNPEVKPVYQPPKPLSCSLLGMENLSEKKPVFIMEGHWDYLSALYHLATDEYDILGCCGSHFPSNYLRVLDGRSVVFFFDNDEAGTQGVAHVLKKAKQTGINIKSAVKVNWVSLTDKYKIKLVDKLDFRDVIIAKGG